jgi:predicted negative regulator of RcsB-dependent stress response
MATLQTDEANIIDAEAVNWRLIVYPILFVLIAVAGGLGYYYYLQQQRTEAETAARAALVKATTPEEFLKVAEQWPHTDQATLAILRAADTAFAQRDFQAALDNYQKITGDLTVDAVLRDSAQLGIASAQEGLGNQDRAIAAYLEVAQRGDKSPFAPYAYSAVANIDDLRGDKQNERQILTQAASLDPDSVFTKNAQYKLKEMSAAAQPPATLNVPATPSAPTPAAPTPFAPEPTPPAK